MSTKGGTGKSTIAIGLAIEISKLLDRKGRVVVIDADRHIKTAELKMIEIKPEDPRLDDVLEGRSSWKDAVYSCNLMLADTNEYLYPNLSILPAGAHFMPVDQLDPDLKRLHLKVDRFSDLVDELKERCEFVIIDTPASYGLEHLVMIAAADTIIPIVNANDDSIKSTLEMLKETRSVLDYVDVAGFVFNRVPERMQLDPWIKKASRIGDLLGIIPFDRYVDLAFSQNYPVAALYPEAPSVRALRDLTERVTSLIVPETKLSVTSKLERTIDVLAREELRKRMEKRKKK